MRRNGGKCFGNNPIASAARNGLGWNFDETTTMNGKKVASRKYLDVDDRLNAVEIIMSMDFASDDLLLDMVNVTMDGFMDDSLICQYTF